MSLASSYNFAFDHVKNLLALYAIRAQRPIAKMEMPWFNIPNAHSINARFSFVHIYTKKMNTNHISELIMRDLEDQLYSLQRVFIEVFKIHEGPPSARNLLNTIFTSISKQLKECAIENDTNEEISMGLSSISDLKINDNIAKCNDIIETESPRLITVSYVREY